MRTEVIEQPPDYLADPSYLAPWLDTYVAGPDEGHYFCGAQVGWSPERERPAGLPACDLASRLETTVCPTCGTSELGKGGVAADGTEYVCARCHAWGRDGWLADRMLREAIRRGTCLPEPRPPEPPQGRPENDAEAERLAAIRDEWAARPPFRVRRQPDGSWNRVAPNIGAGERRP